MLLAATNAKNADWKMVHAELIAKELKMKSRRLKGSFLVLFTRKWYITFVGEPKTPIRSS